MNNKIILTAVICLIVGGLVGVGITKAYKKVDDRDYKNHGSMMMDHNMDRSSDSSMSHTMDNMTSGLKDKKGAEFDKAFITEMIMHHEGAIEMAELALTNAERQEIKDLAKAIIEAQALEINQMKQWQQSWFKN